MAEYEREVLNPTHFNTSSGLFVYKPRITVERVLSIAGGYSRSTLKAAHHADLKTKLDGFLATLRRKTGKAERAASSDDEPDGRATTPQRASRAWKIWHRP